MQLTLESRSWGLPIVESEVGSGPWVVTFGGIRFAFGSVGAAARTDADRSPRRLSHAKECQTDHYTLARSPTVVCQGTVPLR